MSSNSELACVYSALILHDDGVAITVGDELKLSECNSYSEIVILVKGTKSMKFLHGRSFTSRFVIDEVLIILSLNIFCLVYAVSNWSVKMFRIQR